MIEPVSASYFRPITATPSRPDDAVAPGGAPASGNGPGPITRQPEPTSADMRLQEEVQAGRETSALLSMLPGPNLGFYPPPSPPQFLAGRESLSAPAFGPGAFSPSGSRERLNVPLLETLQTGRETSTLLSGLAGPGPRAFPAPTPPAFDTARGTFAPPAGAGAAAPGALPRAAAPLLEAEQQGRISSALFSALEEPGTREVAPTAGAALPAAPGTRFAREAYQAENQARRDQWMGDATGPARRWEWQA